MTGNLLRLAAAAAAALLLAACVSATRRTTVPEIGEVPGEVPLGTLVASGYDQDSRNDWIEINVIRIDREFDDYRRHLQAWRTWGDVSSQSIGLMANIASSLTDSSGVKANWAALNMLVTGLDGIADREKFMEQTINALIAAMEGRRAQVYTRLRTGMERPETQYRLVDAHRDMLAYSAAGRLEDGMSFVADATDDAAREAEAASADAIQEVVMYSADEQKVSQCVSDTVRALAQDPQGADTLAAVMDEAQIARPPGADAKALRLLILQAKSNQPAAYQARLLAALRKRNHGNNCPGV